MSRYIDDRLEKAILALVATPSRDLADVIAKASALEAIQVTSWGDCSVDWRDDLALNIGHELLVVTGGLDLGQA